MTKMIVNVTKEVIEKSAGCTGKFYDPLGSNCAIAVAIKDRFPFAHVCKTYIDMDYWLRHPKADAPTECHIKLPAEAIAFIDKFDYSKEADRLTMKPISFEIDIPGSTKMNREQNDKPSVATEVKSELPSADYKNITHELATLPPEEVSDLKKAFATEDQSGKSKTVKIKSYE